MKRNRIVTAVMCLLLPAGFAMAQQTNEQARQDAASQAVMSKKQAKQQEKADKDQVRADKKEKKAASTHEAKDAAKAQDKADKEQSRVNR